MTTPAPDWSVIEELFFQALELPVEERASWLAAMVVDSELAADVLSLLRAHSGAEAAAAPKRISHYRLVRLIGRGGMGEVWLAERDDGQFEQTVAIKLVRTGLGAGALLPRFRQERQMLARLNHRNITRLLDGGISPDGRPYLVMEWVDGQPILEYADRHHLDIRARLQLFRTLCDAVEYAHHNLTVHRDVKPANVLVTKEGVTKLLDFGIAKLLKGEWEEQTAGLTHTGVRLLTPEYASPEQVRGLPVTTATDIYSLGMLLYVLLTGHKPYVFASDSPGEVERVISEVYPVPPSRAADPAKAKNLEGDLDTIVLKALRKDPAQRYRSVEQLSGDIQRHLDGLPIQARPQTLIYRSRRFLRRNRMLVTAGALVALSLTGGLAAALWQARIARAESLLAERRFNDVRQLAHSFLFDFQDSIQNLPGATPARHLVVNKALEYLNRLNQENGGDPRILGELAEAYLRVGQLQGGIGLANLGDTAGARRSFERALEIAQEAVRREPGNLDWQQYLARSEMSMGDLAGLSDGPAAALRYYSEAQRTYDTIAPQLAHDVTAQFEYARVYGALGDYLGNPGLDNVGDYQGAKQAYEKGLAIQRSIARDHPDNLRSLQNTGVDLMKIGDVERGMGDWNAALSLYEGAAATLDDARKRDPMTPTTRLYLALATDKVGLALENTGKTHAALEQYERASDLHRQLMQADPRNEMMANSYLLSLQAQADLLRNTGEGSAVKTARARYQEALGIAQRLSDADPGNLRRKGRCGDILVAVGALAFRTGDRAEALRDYREGLNLIKLRADRSGATPYDVSEYAEQLLACPFKNLANRGLTIAYARKAVALTTPSSAQRNDLERLLAKAQAAAQ